GTAPPRGREHVGREVLGLLDARAAREEAEHGGRVRAEDLLEPRVAPHGVWGVRHRLAPSLSGAQGARSRRGGRPRARSMSRAGAFLRRASRKILGPNRRRARRIESTPSSLSTQRRCTKAPATG